MKTILAILVLSGCVTAEAYDPPALRMAAHLCEFDATVPTCPEGYVIACPARSLPSDIDPATVEWEEPYEPYCMMQDGRAVCAWLDGGRVLEEGPPPVCVRAHVSAS